MSNIAPVWQTTNRALAITLATCGVPFAKDDDGRDVPFIHLYDVKVLRRFRAANGEPIYAGLSLEEGARRAFREGRAGLMVYNFQRTPLCERVCKAYDAASKAIEQADATGIPAPLHLASVEPEDAAAICAQFTKNRNVFTHGWKAVQPYLHYPGDSRQTSEGGKTIIIGSFRLVPLKLS